MNGADRLPAPRVFLSLVAQAKWCDDRGAFIAGLLQYWIAGLDERDRFALMCSAVAACVDLLDEAVNLHDQALKGGAAITAEALLGGLLQATYER